MGRPLVDNALDPWLVVVHPHIDARQVGVGTLDAVGDGASQEPSAVVTPHRQGSTTVTLRTKGYEAG